jgi:hypothetical protein
MIKEHMKICSITLTNRRMQIKLTVSPALTVAHFCNPIYSGGGDQEDLGSKPGQGNSSGDPISKKKKKKITKKG